jgi:hypothetical protein
MILFYTSYMNYLFGQKFPFQNRSRVPTPF